jgi:cytochrome c
MKHRLVAALAALIPCAAHADAMDPLLQKSGCSACHAPDRKIVGPAFRDVAAKYKGDATAPAKLEKKVKEGGAGVWGPVPMPPNANVSDADIKTLVSYVLSLK